VNGSETEHRFSGDAAENGRDPAKIAFNYAFPPPESKHQQYGEPGVNFNTGTNPLSKFKNRDTSDEGDRVTRAFSRECELIVLQS